MEILLIVVVAVVIGALIYVNHNKDVIDTNKDGKVDKQEAKAAVKEVAKKAIVKAKTAGKKLKN